VEGQERPAPTQAQAGGAAWEPAATGGPGLHQRHDEVVRSRGSGSDGGCSGNEEEKESEARLGFQTNYSLFIRHHISSWLPNPDKRSRLLHIRVV
jgi:hypothetical protein